MERSSKEEEKNNDDNKFLALKFNLKNEILDFLPLYQLRGRFFGVNKKIIFALRKRKAFIYLKDNYKNMKRILSSNNVIPRNILNANLIKNGISLDDIEDTLIYTILKTPENSTIKLENANQYIELNYIIKILKSMKKIFDFNVSGYQSFVTNEKESITLFRAININNSIEELNFNNCRLGLVNYNTKNFSIALSNLKSIKSLKIAGCDLCYNPQLFEEFCGVLKNNTTLINLDMESNNIGEKPENVCILMNAFIDNKTLANIKLGYNLICEELKSIFHVSNLLEKNKIIKSIDLKDKFSYTDIIKLLRKFDSRITFNEPTASYTGANLFNNRR